MSNIMSKFKNMFTPEDENDEEEKEEMEEVERKHEPASRPVVHPTPLPQPKVVSLGAVNKMELLNFTMLSYDMT